MKVGEIWKDKEDCEEIKIVDIWTDNSVGHPIDYVEYVTTNSDKRINVLEQRDFIMSYEKVYTT